ncbi:MAG: hypothetical protein WA555_07055 [Candidatus Sulfotelmatobacter sp.]
MRFLIRIVLAALIAISIGAGLLFYHAHRAMAAARQYVSDASRLQIGISGEREFARVRDKYSRYAEIDPNCNDQDCIARFKFDNGLPKNFYLIHSGILYSVLTLSKGAVTESVIGSLCWGSNGGQYLAQTVELLPNPMTFVGPFQADRNMSSDKVGHLTFELTPAASAEQRARAYAFDVKFVGRFGACNDATDMH